MIIIENPIWKGDQAFDKRCIGIAEYRLLGEKSTVEIQIVKKRKTGEYVYPSIYVMDVKDIVKYPIDYVGHGKKIKVYIIPIKDLKVKPDINITKIVNCPLNTNKVEILAVQKGFWE